MKIPDLTLKIGRMNRLRVVTLVDYGAYLDGKDRGEILMPGKYLPENCEVGDFVEAFVYLDSEDRLVATTEEPYAMEGELAYLKVVAATPIGAFLDWGVMKDLLVPFREQKEHMYVGDFHIVYIYLDKATDRLAASTKVHKFLTQKVINYALGDEVQLIICNEFELGYNVIIDKRFLGVIYANEVFQPLEPGQKIQGYIKTLRADGKIDVVLRKTGEYGLEDLTEQILFRLRSGGGFLEVTDKTPPEVIYDLFHVSKKVYKRAISGLYKKRIIAIEENGIRLN